MADTLKDLALFPLHTVLFPDGLLPLRVFEARYVDMTRECLRENRPFGVCLIRQGHEVAVSARSTEVEAVGCLAHILDCDREPHGTLLVRSRGGQRMRLLDRHVQADGLMRGDALLIEADPLVHDIETLSKLAPCAEVLRRIVATLAARDPDSVPFLAPYRYDDPCWVSNRLAEILPLSPGARQKMMELEHAGARLELVHQYMEKHRLF